MSNKLSTYNINVTVTELGNSFVLVGYLKDLETVNDSAYLGSLLNEGDDLKHR